MRGENGMTLLEVLLAVGLLVSASVPAALLMGNVAQVEAETRFGVVATSLASEQTAAVQAEILANDRAVTIGAAPGPTNPFLQACGPASVTAAPCFRVVHGMRYGITPANSWIPLPTSAYADPPAACGKIDEPYVMSASGATVVAGPPLVLLVSAEVSWQQGGSTAEEHESTLVTPPPTYFWPSYGYANIQVTDPTDSALIELSSATGSSGNSDSSGTVERYAELGPGGCAFFVNVPPGQYEATPVSASSGTAVGASVTLDVQPARGTVATVLING